MKSDIRYLLAFLALSVQAHAQSSIVASSGSSNLPDLKVDWTLGEIVVESFDNGAMSVASGLHSIHMVIITGDIDTEDKQRAVVYPVPFIHEFFIERKDQTSDFEFTLLDPSGKEIPVRYSSEGNTYRVQTTDLASGPYFLVIQSSNSNTRSVFKLLKK